jgi:hypothetical protein
VLWIDAPNAFRQRAAHRGTRSCVGGGTAPKVMTAEIVPHHVRLVLAFTRWRWGWRCHTLSHRRRWVRVHVEVRPVVDSPRPLRPGAVVTLEVSWSLKAREGAVVIVSRRGERERVCVCVCACDEVVAFIHLCIDNLASTNGGHACKANVTQHVQLGDCGHPTNTDMHMQRCTALPSTLGPWRPCAPPCKAHNLKLTPSSGP